MNTQDKIKLIAKAIEVLLIAKNKMYGDSALAARPVFFKGCPGDAILIRLNDKLARIENRDGELRKNDVVDLMGYLVLLCASKGWVDFEDLID